MFTFQIHIPCLLSLGYLLWLRCGTNPLVHHGRHFGPTVHAMCSVSTLINNALSRLVEIQENPDMTLSPEEVDFL